MKQKERFRENFQNPPALAVGSFNSDSGRHCKFSKRYANKVVRHKECGNGGEFKKHFESWNIKDWKFKIKDINKKNMSK